MLARSLETELIIQDQIILEPEMRQAEIQNTTLQEIAIPIITPQEATIATLLQEAQIQAQGAKV